MGQRHKQVLANDDLFSPACHRRARTTNDEQECSKHEEHTVDSHT